MSTSVASASPRRLPAGALLLVLTISIIVAALLLSLIYLAANRRLLVQRDTLHQRLQRNLYSGLAYAQAHAEQRPFQVLALDLFGQGNDSVQVLRKPWGVFDVAIVNASKGPFRDTIVALLGSTFSPVNQAALYLANEKTSLAVNDDAQVRGGAWLPNAGDVRPGNLPLTGSHRTGPAITGKVQASQNVLPLASDSALVRVKEYAQLQLANVLPANTQFTTELRYSTTSFLNTPFIWYHADPFTVARQVTGQVVIISSKRLVVEASSQLDNVLLLAPTIVVKAGFRGRVQLIARDTIAVAENCLLSYPSAVCAYGTSKSSLVSLGPDTHVQGVVLAAAALPGPACMLQMAPSTMVEGQVFSAGVIKNCGVVHGSVMCRQLMYQGVGSYYENYLVNSTLDRSALSPHFLTTPLLNRAAAIGVIAWLP